jgi:hypothetical protein
MDLAARAKRRVTNMPVRVFIRKPSIGYPSSIQKTFQYLTVTNCLFAGLSNDPQKRMQTILRELVYHFDRGGQVVAKY